MSVPRSQAAGRDPNAQDADRAKLGSRAAADRDAGPKVNVFADKLDHARWIEILPNGQLLVAEAMSHDRAPRSVYDYAMIATMRRANAMGKRSNRITLLRDSEGDGVAEMREIFLSGQNQPFVIHLDAEVGPFGPLKLERMDRVKKRHGIVDPIEVRVLPRNESADRRVQTVRVTN